MHEKYKRSSPEDLEAIYHKSNKDLLNILSKEQYYYSDEIIAAIKTELIKRGTPLNDVELSSENYFKSVNKNQIAISKSGSRFLKYAGMVLGLALGSAIVNQCNHNTLYVEPINDKWVNVKTGLNEISDSLFIGDDSKSKFCNCVLSKFQYRYPEGENIIPSDTIKKLSLSFSYDCSSHLTGLNFNTQSQNFANELKIALNKSGLLKKIVGAYKEPFCDCVVREIRKQYPLQLNTEIPQKLRDSIYVICAQKIKKNSLATNILKQHGK